jgi:RnfABCDGE-type electron transport complex B subunit
MGKNIFFEIIIPALSLCGLGAVFGAGLAIAAKKFCVTADPRLQEILQNLPGANCGACGMAGCLGFSEGLIRGSCTIEKCALMHEEERQQIAKILGIEAREKEKLVAALHCGAGIKVRDSFVYRGTQECVAANLVMGGQKECVFGCLGFGDCVKICPFGAIKMSDEGLPVVEQDKCKACNKCVIACPKKLFTLIPVTSTVYVACSSHDPGKDTKRVCSVGCIACGLCVKACKFNAIHVIDNLAVIDYHKCTSCGECVLVCPVKCIRIRE